MGAGQGKLKRVQALGRKKHQVAIRPSEVFYSDEAWTDFLKTNQLTDMRLNEYYLGHSVNKYDVQNCDKIYTELFNDAVAVGAIELPGNIQANEFRFETKIIQNGNALSEFILMIFYHNKVRTFQGMFNIPINDRLCSSFATEFLLNISRGVQEILNIANLKI